MMLSAGARSVWLLPFVFTTGCYGYVAVPSVQSVQRGMDVRAQLTSDAAVRHSQGRDEPIMRYEGVIVDVAPDTLALDVLIARASGALQDVVIRDTVNLATAEIQTMMRRELSVSKTALFTLAAVGGAAALIAGIDQVVGGTGDPPDGGDPTFRPPLFSFQTLRLLLGLR
jgi:hypothetical protein